MIERIDLRFFRPTGRCGLDRTRHSLWLRGGRGPRLRHQRGGRAGLLGTEIEIEIETERVRLGRGIGGRLRRGSSFTRDADAGRTHDRLIAGRLGRWRRLRAGRDKARRRPFDCGCIGTGNAHLRCGWLRGRICPRIISHQPGQFSNQIIRCFCLSGHRLRFR